jgi:hypothetical protein
LINLGIRQHASVTKGAKLAVLSSATKTLTLTPDFASAAACSMATIGCFDGSRLGLVAKKGWLRPTSRGLLTGLSNPLTTGLPTAPIAPTIGGEDSPFKEFAMLFRCDAPALDSVILSVRSFMNLLPLASQRKRPHDATYPKGILITKVLPTPS